MRKLFLIQPIMILLLSAVFVYSQDDSKIPYDFVVARVHYGGGGDWYSGSSSLPNLLAELRKRLNLRTPQNNAVVRILDPNFYNFPFLYLTGHGNVHFSEQEVRVLRDYLTNGGFLWGDDDFGLIKHFKREMGKVFPGNEWVELPSDHKIFSCFYKLDGLPKIHEHAGKRPQLFAMYYNGRIVSLFTYETDIGDGMVDKEIYNNPDHIREKAFQMATNIVWYFLNGNL